MPIARLNDIHVHFRVDGPPGGAPLVLANALGTDLRIWDAVLPWLPAGLRILRYDMRGHGLSDAPDAPYAMGTLVNDAERLMQHMGMRDAVFVGLSIGGMIAQGLAVKRLDLVRGLVLCNTAARLATPAIWAERIAAVRASGMAAVVEDTMERWFPRPFRDSPDAVQWRNMVLRTPVEGYAGGCAAISGTDFLTTTASLTLPALALVGSEDGSTPPDLVRETAALIPGSRFELIRGAGHLPCIDKPDVVARHLTRFLGDIGHV